MAVEVEIENIEIPSRIEKTEKFTLKIRVKTEGSGEDFIGGGVFKRPVESGDNPIDRLMFISSDNQGEPEKVTPGETINVNFDIPPLTDWIYTIPKSLEWSIIVGRLEKTGLSKYILHPTDRENYTITVEKEKPKPSIWEQAVQWVKDNPRIVVVGSVGTVALVTYSATRD